MSLDPFNDEPIYNEIDAYACAWMQRLIIEGHITHGRIIQRDIRELAALEIGRARRFHAFAGIGLWDHALALAGWPTDLAVWTGSCPCQPFSVAGRRRGIEDERHLWPEWFRLIRECRPPIVFGEQVASPAGRAWLDIVSADLEGCGYAVGAADLCAAGVGAPHIRQRLYWVAYTNLERLAVRAGERKNNGSELPTPDRTSGAPCGFWDDAEWLSCRDGKARPAEPGTFPLAHGCSGRVAVVRPGEQAETHWYNRTEALKCIGNAIVPQVAAVFIKAALRSIERTGPER